MNKLNAAVQAATDELQKACSHRKLTHQEAQEIQNKLDALAATIKQNTE